MTTLSITTQQAQHARRERLEREAMAKIAERLIEQFPEVPDEEIVRAIQGRYADFEDRRIRDYVPILVERSVRSALRRT